MKSDDLYISITKRIISLATNDAKETFLGIPIIIAFSTPTEKAKLFKKAIFDYSIEKIEETEENKIIVEDIEFIFSRLDRQFSCEKEKEEFYKNYAHCILSEYGELIGTNLTWLDVESAEKEECPKIEDDVFKVPTATSYETSAVWLFRELEKELQKKEEKPKEKKKTSPKHWWGR